MDNEQKKAPSGCGKVLLIIVLVLAILFGLYLGFVWILRKTNNNTSPTTTTSTTKTSTKTADQSLVGSWDTGCMVPDPGSKWAEQHSFTFKTDGTATHVRKSYFINDCTTLQPELTITEAYKYTIPSAGKINLTWTAYDNAQITSIGRSASDYVGHTSYDVYKVSGSTLVLGQGFRNNEKYDGPAGDSETNRFTTFNNYLIYKK